LGRQIGECAGASRHQERQKQNRKEFLQHKDRSVANTTRVVKMDYRFVA
jgi:hypothetical protein